MVTAMTAVRAGPESPVACDDVAVSGVGVDPGKLGLCKAVPRLGVCCGDAVELAGSVVLDTGPVAGSAALESFPSSLWQSLSQTALDGPEDELTSCK